MTVTPLRLCPVVMLSQPVAAMVEYDDACQKGRLLLRQPSGGVLATGVPIPRWGTPLCYVAPAWSQEPTLVLEGVVLGTVAHSLDISEPEGYVLRWNWAYCRGSASNLREWLSELFAFPLDRPADEDLLVDHADETAVIYPFYRQSRAELQGVLRRLRGRIYPDLEGEQAGDVPATEPRVRAHIRANVSVGCTFYCSDVGHSGQQARIYNVGRGGLFVATAGDYLPESGKRVVVRFAVEYMERQVAVEITGRVRWPSRRLKGTTLAGFGISTESIADGARGQIFRAFLGRSVESHLSGETANDGVGPTVANDEEDCKQAV